MKTLFAVLPALVVAGCATFDPYADAPMRGHLAQGDEIGDCARLFRDTDAAIDRARVRDAEAPRVAGFPYLRVNRFVAGLADRAAALPDGFAPWSELMAQLDRDARAAEIGNAGDRTLPAPAALDACRDRLAAADGAQFERLRAAARVPDDYSPAARALGLYPLTRIPFAAGIRRWHEATTAVFAVPPAALPAAGELIRYAPAAPVGFTPPVPRSAAFALPALSAAQWSELLARHAPALLIDTVDESDRPGTLAWGPHDRPRVRVDTQAPVAYARLAFTQIRGAAHAQLVYTFWFAARPAESGVDLLAGDLDGVVWRVTLGRDFAPLVYDTIHPCGCYHLFFPTARVQPRPQPDSLDESMFAPQTVRAPAAGERIVLRVASRTHYLQRVDTEPANAAAPARPYRLRDDDELRRLPRDGGSRSAFDEQGLIAGSERGERFFFWPMGIASAGQMRQWGRHATAFVGRRHFDDPRLFDRYFEVLSPGSD